MLETARHVGAWYYLAVGVLALATVAWAHTRRRHRLAAVVLLTGSGLNLAWELLLAVAWGRPYQSAVHPAVQAGYQALTEFGPLLLSLVLAADAAGWLTVHDRRPSGALPRQAPSALVLASYAALVVALGTIVVTTVGGGSQRVVVHRLVTWQFFALEGLLGLAVLAACVARSKHGAIMAFAVVGGLNVLVELVGLTTGLRTYTGLPPWLSEWALATTIGLAEGGTAAALVWLAVRTLDLAVLRPPQRLREGSAWSTWSTPPEEGRGQ